MKDLADPGTGDERADERKFAAAGWKKEYIMSDFDAPLSACLSHNNTLACPAMARDTNKPQGKPYVYEPPVHKFREKMGKRESFQV